MLMRNGGLNETKLMQFHIQFHKMNFSPQENAKCLPLSEGRMAEYGILTRKSYKTTTTHFFTLEHKDVWCGWVDPLKNKNFYTNPCF